MKRKKKELTPAALDKRLWPEFSAYIRRRDADEGGTVSCISCGVLKFWKEGDCGHYLSRNYGPIKYDEMNNHFQCKPCNGFFEGVKDDYRKALIKRYGEEAVLDLEARKINPLFKKNRTDLLELIEKYKKLNAELDKRLPRKG